MRRRLGVNRPGLLAVVAGVLLLAAPAHGRTVIFVDPDAPAAGDGLSWNTAYRFLQDALAFASVPANGVTEIHVAQGPYNPDDDEGGVVTPGDRAATFQLINGVALMGGYAGLGAPDPDARDINLYVTILSGDLTGNDLPGFVNNDENSFHVVTGSGTDNSAAIDGFTITAGNANGFPDDGDGAGMYNLSGSPVVDNCTFIANIAAYGAGMWNKFSSPWLTNCTFAENVAAQNGGGMWNFDSSPQVIACIFDGNAAICCDGGGMRIKGGSPTVANSTFTDNSAQNGGGIHNLDTSAIITNCTFTGNTAAGFPGVTGGGAMTNFGGSPTIDSCVFKDNTANPGDGGGMANVSSSPTVINCTFVANVAVFAIGGGMSNTQGASPRVEGCTFGGNFSFFGGGIGSIAANPVITDCTFLNNVAKNEGGGVYSQLGAPTIIGCTFGSNHTGFGGAINLNDGAGVATVINCVFSGNIAADGQGGGVAARMNDATIANCTFWQNGPEAVVSDSSNVTVAGCILWENALGQITELGPGGVTVLYSDIDGGWTGPGEGNIDADPLFVDAHGPDLIPGTADDDLRLTSTSPAIDAGDNSGLCCDTFDLDADGDTSELIPIDRDGNTRRLDVSAVPDTGNGLFPLSDMGAYEFDPSEPPETSPLRIWVGGLPGGNPPNGNFDIAGNWQGALPPGVSHIAVFDIDDAYTVTFQSNPTSTDRLHVRRGEVTFDLNGNAYDLLSGSADDLVVGELPGDQVTLQITNGTLNVAGAKIGLGASTGTIDVAGAAATFDFGVNLAVDNGNLIVRDSATVTTSSALADVSIFRKGLVTGDSSILANVQNFGTVAPALNGPGSLAIDGDYEQLGEVIPGNPTSGSLEIEFAGPTPGSEFDVLSITGDAFLGGGLFVERTNPLFDPAASDSFQILAANTVTDTFDVAFMPPLPGDKFMRVQYVSGSPLVGTGGSVNVVVDTLASLFKLGSPFSSDIPVPGAPSAVALGDFDNQDGTDLAIAIPNPDPLFNGSVLILYNDGTDGMGDWLGFGGVAGSLQITVGRSPTDLVVADLDNDLDLDIAVTNAADNDLSILLNDGFGVLSLEPNDVSVGSSPSALAAEDFTGDNFPDLVVANAGDDNIQILINDGSAGFLATGIFDVGDTPVAVEVEDLDDNKDVSDLIVVNRDSNDISIFGGLGGGSFGFPITVDVGDAPAGLATAVDPLNPDFERMLPDLDGIGQEELVTVNSGDGTVSVILNLSTPGTLAFAPAVNLPVGDLPRSLTALDVDNDADLDLAVVANDELGEGVVQVLRNDVQGGLLVFADAAEIDLGDDPLFVISGDVDGDFDDDLITVNAGMGAAASSGEPTPIGAGPATGSWNVRLNRPVCPADMNGDDVVDVLDLIELLLCFGQPALPDCTSADVNLDGTVDVLDLIELLLAFGTTCP